MSSEISDAPGMRMYYEGSLSYGIYAFIWFGLIAVAVTLWRLSRETTSRYEKYVLLVAWGIVPPIWFLVEYYFIFMPYGAKHSFQFFEYSQSVAAKVWAAVFALITISLYKDREKGNEENKAKKQETD
jgi:hypothetical protein